jgi:hypothetical protein
VKPVPITILIFIEAHAFGDTRNEAEIATADMITITFFLLIQPGEYADTVSDDAAFKLQDVHNLYIQCRSLDSCTASTAELKAETSLSYTFTTQKNGNCNEKIVQRIDGDHWCCSFKAKFQSSRSQVKAQCSFGSILPG